MTPPRAEPLLQPDEDFALPVAPNENRWAVLVAAFAVLLTLVPYLVGASLANGRRFMWLGYNLDDSCVYLSWMRQAADGSFRALNLFTTEPQHGMALNPVFLVLGKFAGLTGLPLLGVYHGARLLFGFALLLAVWRFITLALSEIRARRLAFLFVCFASGLGWMPFWWDANPINTPIDKWQPEAITFLSLYLSPLFCFSLLLQVGILTLLWQGERRRSLKCAAGAGVCGFLLGLVHTYDVVSLAAVWLTYLVLTALRQARNPGTKIFKMGWWLRTLVAGLLTAPAVAYVAYELKTEAVFRARANVETLSPSPVWLLFGFGLTFVLAIVGGTVLLRPRTQPRQADANNSTTTPQEVILPSDNVNPAAPGSPDAALLLIAWAVANVAVSYVPVAFQRKMLQGAHFPIAILAGMGAAWLLSRNPERKATLTFGTAAVASTLFLSLTNLRFMARDIANYRDNRAQTGIHRTYLKPGEINALLWLRDHTPADAAVQPLPYLALSQTDQGRVRVAPLELTVAAFTPGLAHRAVYCGHWGETPDFGPKLGEISRLTYALPDELTTFAVPHISEENRLALLRKMKVRYLLYSQKEEADQSASLLAPMFHGSVPLPAYLTQVYSNSDADVYEFHDPNAR